MFRMSSSLTCLDDWRVKKKSRVKHSKGKLCLVFQRHPHITCYFNFVNWQESYTRLFHFVFPIGSIHHCFIIPGKSKELLYLYLGWIVVCYWRCRAHQSSTTADSPKTESLLADYNRLQLESFSFVFRLPAFTQHPPQTLQYFTHTLANTNILSSLSFSLSDTHVLYIHGPSSERSLREP